MKKDLVVRPLLNAKFSDPETIVISGKYYPVMNKVLLKNLTSNLGMKSRQFSKTLYGLDPDIWKMLADKVSGYSEVQDYKDSKSAIIIEGELKAVVNIDAPDQLEELVKQIARDLGVEDSLVVNWSLETLELTILKNDLGVHFIYYFESNWLSVYNFIYKPDDGVEVYYNPVEIISNEVEDSFESLVDSRIIAQYLGIDYDSREPRNDKPIIEYSYEEFKRLAEDSNLSVGELLNELKKGLGIKYNPELTGFDVAADSEAIRYDSVSTNLLDKLFESIKHNQRIALYSSDLKKSITFDESTDVVLNYYKLLAYLVVNSSLDVRILVNFIRNVVSRSINFYQIYDGIN